jgi:TolA-binding protein
MGLLSRVDIESALQALNSRLAARSETAELAVVGGAVMCLAYDARPATKDVDGWFAPSEAVRQAAREVAEMLAECQRRLARKELLIARFYVKRKAWRSVEGRARGLLAAYPESEYAVETMALLAEAYAWQGKVERTDEVLARLAELAPEEHKRAVARVSRARARAEG